MLRAASYRVMRVLKLAILYWRLLRDPRVSVWPKLLVVGALIYLVAPIDLLSDIALPGIGYLEDGVILVLAGRLFISLCPPGVVAEHMARIEEKTRWWCRFRR